MWTECNIYFKKIAKVYWLSQASARLPIFFIIIIYCYVAVNATVTLSVFLCFILSLVSLVNIVYKYMYIQHTMLLRKKRKKNISIINQLDRLFITRYL